MYQDLCKLDEAEEMNRRALSGREEVLGRENPETLLSADNLASVLMSKGEFNAAEEMSRRALEGKEKLFGKHHPETATSANNLSFILLAAKELRGSKILQLSGLRGIWEYVWKRASEDAICGQRILFVTGRTPATSPFQTISIFVCIRLPRHLHPLLRGIPKNLKVVLT